MKKNKFKKEYEELLASFTPEMTLEEIHEKWHKCFRYFLKSLHVGFTDKAVNHLFYGWRMNYVGDKTIHNYSDAQWKEFFCEQCKGLLLFNTSVDHLFQAHHTYIRVVKNHMANISTANF